MLNQSSSGEVLAEALIEIGRRLYQAEEYLRQETWRREQAEKDLAEQMIAEKKALENYYSLRKREVDLEAQVTHFKHKNQNQAEIIKALEDSGKELHDKLCKTEKEAADEITQAWAKIRSLERQVRKSKRKK